MLQVTSFSFLPHLVDLLYGERKRAWPDCLSEQALMVPEVAGADCA
jgi:hypothetical protein